jgi:hypothetical protein
MRNKFLVVALGFGLMVGGCAELQNLQTVLSAATKSVTNPVTNKDLYEVESGMDIAFIALNSYKKACVAGAVDVNCKSNIEAIQQYTRQLPPMVAQLRSFVKSNDQINATVVYNQIVTLTANLKTAAANLGVKIGA